MIGELSCSLKSEELSASETAVFLGSWLLIMRIWLCMAFKGGRSYSHRAHFTAVVQMRRRICAYAKSS